MVHFEFGVFVLFSTTLLGLVGFVLQNHFLLPPWLAWYNHAGPMRRQPLQKHLPDPRKRCRWKRGSRSASRVAPR